MLFRSLEIEGGGRGEERVPLRSAFGNKVTSWLFKTLTAIRVGDTQTGLRAYPPSLLEWLGTVPGERFEYELSLLLQAGKAGISIREDLHHARPYRRYLRTMFRVDDGSDERKIICGNTSISCLLITSPKMISKIIQLH